MNYHNEINQLVQNDNNVSADLKAKYAKENEKLNKLNSVIDSILQNMDLSVNDIESKYQFC